MDRSDMEVSIIIPLYKRIDWIGICIEKLFDQDYDGDYEIIIVDDGSPNGNVIKETCNKYIGKGDIVVKYLRNKHAGPAAARNYGVKASTGKILCFLDDDSLPNKEWLREILRPFSDSSQAGLVSGRTFSFERTGLPLLLEESVYPEKSWATCNIAYRRDAFAALTGFDEYYTEPSWEDNDLGLRAQWAGFDHCYNQQAVVYHPHESSIAEYKKKCLLNGRGAAAFSRKYLYQKPLVSIATPVIMSRKLVYCIFPWVWLQKQDSRHYLRFLWSFYSLRGFMKALLHTNENDCGCNEVS